MPHFFAIWYPLACRPSLLFSVYDLVWRDALRKVLENGMNNRIDGNGDYSQPLVQAAHKELATWVQETAALCNADSFNGAMVRRRNGTNSLINSSNRELSLSLIRHCIPIPFLREAIRRTWLVSKTARSFARFAKWTPGQPTIGILPKLCAAS